MKAVFGKMPEMVIVSVSQVEIIDLRCGILIIRREIIDDGKIEDTIPDGLQARIKRNFFEGFKSSRFVGKRVTDYRADKTLFIPDGTLMGYRSTGYHVFARLAS